MLVGRKNIGNNDQEKNLSKFPVSLVLLLMFGGFVFAPSLNSGDYLSTTRTDAGQNIRNLGFILSYSVSFFYLFRWPASSFLLIVRCAPLIILTFYASTSALWSSDPNAVMHLSAHAWGLVLVATATTHACKNDINRFYSSVFLATLAVLIVSTIVAVGMPEYGVSYIRSSDNAPLTSRWNGITSHPNTLGEFAVTAVWAGLAWKENIRRSFGRFCVLIGIIFSFYVSAVGCQSMTSTIVEAFLIVLFSITNKKDFRPVITTSHILIGAIFAALFFGIILIFINRDMTFSGRTQIWELAFDFIRNKPILGWSFDGGAGFNTESSSQMHYTSFHNGYLQLLVLGGTLGFTFFLMVLGSMLRSMSKLRKIDPVISFTFFAFTLAAIIHNFTEATFFSVCTPIWTVLVCFWALIEYRLRKINGIKNDVRQDS